MEGGTSWARGLVVPAVLGSGGVTQVTGAREMWRELAGPPPQRWANPLWSAVVTGHEFGFSVRSLTLYKAASCPMSGFLVSLKWLEDRRLVTGLSCGSRALRTQSP